MHTYASQNPSSSLVSVMEEKIEFPSRFSKISVICEANSMPRLKWDLIFIFFSLLWRQRVYFSIVFSSVGIEMKLIS